MSSKRITQEQITAFRRSMIEDEKSPATIKKYSRDVEAFWAFVGDGEVTKETVIGYKLQLLERYAPASVNSMLAALNHFFKETGRYDCLVKALKIQRLAFRGKERELTKTEYYRLLDAAKKKKDMRLYLLMQTICATGIRISELRFITKVFPHNLRHLFACHYYKVEKDLSHLADLLGHSSLNTTRIYTSLSGTEQQRQIDRLGLVPKTKTPHNTHDAV